MALTDKDGHELSAMRGRVADAARRITGAPGQPGGPPLAEGIRKGPWAPGGVGDVQRIWVDHRTIEDRNMLHVPPDVLAKPREYEIAETMVKLNQILKHCPLVQWQRDALAQALGTLDSLRP